MDTAPHPAKAMQLLASATEVIPLVRRIVTLERCLPSLCILKRGYRFVLLSILTASANPAMAASTCSADEVEAVEVIIRHETTFQTNGSGADLQLRGRGEATLYFSQKGDEYSRESGERRIPDGLLASGDFHYRWVPYEKETWHTGTDIYRSSTGEKRQSHRHTQAVTRFHDPQIPIAQASARHAKTSRVAGFRCRMAQQTLATGTTLSTCNLEVYGRPVPLDWEMRHKDGSAQSKRLLSLQTICVDASLFKVPERDWK